MQSKSDRIRVLLVVPRLATGGSERVAFSLLKYLDHQLFDVAVVSLFPYSGFPFEREAAKSGLQVHYLSKRLGLDPGSFLRVDRLFRKFKPQVVQNHLHHLYIVLPAYIRNRIPVCLHRFSNVAHKELANRHRRLLYSVALRHLRVVPVAISAQIRQSVQQLLGSIDMPVIFSGVDVESFAPFPEQRAEWRKNNHLKPNTPVFVHVGRFAPQKNHDLLIHSFADVVRHYPDTILLLAGEGELLPAVKELVNRQGLQEKVRFLGPRQDVADLLNASDVFVLPSDWEGVPVSALEAMAAGKPIIATAVGGVPEIIESECNGFLVPPGNIEMLTQAMLTLCNNQTLIRRMGERSRQIAVERFDVRMMAQRYGELYLQLLERHRKAGR